MTARIIDGRAVARKLRLQYQDRVTRLRSAQGISPGLAVILVGGNPASPIYVNNKVRACEQIGIRSERIEFPAEVEEARLLAQIDRLNGDVNTHGILVQLPLPAHIAMRRILERISVSKDPVFMPPLSAR